MKATPMANLTALNRTEGRRGHRLDAPPTSRSDPQPRHVDRQAVARRRARNRAARASRKANR